MKFKKLILLISSMMLLGGCDGEFDGVTYPQDKETPKITFINPSESSKEFTVGDDSYVVTYNIGGRNGVTNKNVTLSSDDPNVATIAATTVEDNPYAVMISPVGAGETNVNIISQNNPDVKAAIKVKVNPRPAGAGIIKLKTPLTSSINVNEEIDIEVKETNGNVVWSVEYGYDYFELVNGDNEKVTVVGKKPGTANVRATVNGVYAVQSITVKPDPVKKTVYFVDMYGCSELKMNSSSGAKDLDYISYNEFGQKTYSFDIDGTKYEHFTISYKHYSAEVLYTRSIYCNEFVSKNGIKMTGEGIEIFNFTPPKPTVSFISNTFKLLQGYTDTISVSSFLGDVVYEISDETKVSKIASGNDFIKIKGLAAGTATITATIKDTDISDTIEVNVLNRPAPSVNFDALSTLSVEAEDTLELPYSVVYNFSGEPIQCPVTWEITEGSSFASVTPFSVYDSELNATVTKIRIAGFAAGEAKLKASYNFDQETEFIITVTPVLKKTIFFSNNKCWNEVYVYAWNDTNHTENHAWPGVKIESEPVYNDRFEDCYEFTFKAKLYEGVIFNNGDFDRMEQTKNISISEFGSFDNVYIKGDAEEKEGKFIWDYGFANINRYDEDDTYTVYLNALCGWNSKEVKQKIFTYCWINEENHYSILMHNVSGDLYVAKIPKTHTNLKFVRNSYYVTSMVWRPDGNFWGETGDLTYNSSKTQFNIETYVDGYSTGSWSTKA